MKEYLLPPIAMSPPDTSGGGCKLSEEEVRKIRKEVFKNNPPKRGTFTTDGKPVKKQDKFHLLEEEG